jgi:hypothetical protein
MTRSAAAARTCAVGAVVALALASPAARTQVGTPVVLPWSGWVECVFTAQASRYTHAEKQRWTITGAPTIQDNVHVYAALWEATGEGAFQGTNGRRSQTARWSVNVPGQPVQIGITHHAAGLTIQKWSARTVARAGLTGVERLVDDAVVRPPNALSLDVDERQFPRIDGATDRARIAGSGVVPFNGASAPRAPGQSQGTAACTWDFHRSVTTAPSGSISSAAASNVPTGRTFTAIPGGTVTPVQLALSGRTAVVTGVQESFAIQLALNVPPPDTGIVESASLVLESTDGQKVPVSMPKGSSAPSASASLTFQKPGNYVVTARGRVTITRQQTVTVTVYEPVYTTHPSCDCTMMTGYRAVVRTETRSVSESHGVSADHQVTVHRK